MKGANLVRPLVDGGHADVVDEDGHAFAAGRAKGAALALLYRTLNAGLRARVEVTNDQHCVGEADNKHGRDLEG